MSDVPDKDPFAEGDPRAAEREARRREREERRKSRSAGARKSLADRVSGAIGGGAAGSRPSEAEPDQPPATQQPPAEPPPVAPPEPAASEPRAPEQPEPPASPAPPPAEPPTDVRRGETEDWFADTELEPGPDTSEWRAATGERDAVTGERTAVTGERAAVTGDHGVVPPAVGGGGGRGYGRVPTARGSGGPGSPWIRRLIAAGIVLVALGAIVLIAKAALGGGDDPAEVVRTANQKVKTISVTIPEGLTIDQIADVAKDAKLKGDYEKAVEKAGKKFPLEEYGAEGADNMEGFLFPATYELEQDAPVDDLVAKQLEAFQLNFDPIDMKAAEKKNLTPYDVLKIASMVEKEVQVEKERELVAAVIYNRLAAGDTLGIDATLRYELENYDEQLLQSELDAATPYNTRVTAGLPPTPISNPGVASMEAAAQPAKTDAYFFVVKPGTCGEHFFTADSAEFEQAAAEYTAALDAEGGSPTEC